MIRENIFRFALTVLLLAFAGLMYWRSGTVDEWLVGLVGFAIGNSFRLSASAPKVP